jgi:hypothetical protein
MTINLPKNSFSRIARMLARFLPAQETRKARASSRRRSQESGFAYLMALFMVLLLLVTSTAAVSNLRMDARRRREEEMIWRGNQYVRAIRLFYRKSGHYPQTIDDLQKGLPELHFLRLAAYKDPLNTSDGAWRFIYVNATGQIIGSVRYATLQQMALMDLGGQPVGATPGFPGVPVSTLVNTSGMAAPGAQPAQTSTATPSTPPADSGSGQNPASAQPGQSAPNSPQPGQPGAGPASALISMQPTGPVDGPVLGAFLTGVGSTVDRTTIKTYNGATDYNQWEFIWNPIEDQARAVQQGMGQGQMPNLLGQPGATGFGGSAFGGGGIGAPGSAQPGPGSGGIGAPGSAQPSPSPSPQSPQ